MKFVSHQQVSQLFHNKFIVVLGDSIQRSVYKDLVLLLQKDKYLNLVQLKRRGEMSFEQDCLVEGGCLSQMHNGTGYREVRQYQSAHHLVRFYFVTRIYSDYMKSIMEDFRQGLKPDLVIVNSCVWDISRYTLEWVDKYKDNLKRFFEELLGILPEESLVIWNLAMPLGERIKGGFVVPEQISHKAPHLRHDVIEANFYSGVLASASKVDVLDLHFHFRFALQHRTNDGVHWNALGHRRISTLVSLHAADAWGVELPLPSLEDFPVAHQLPGREGFPEHVEWPPTTNWCPHPPFSDFPNFEANPPPLPYWHGAAAFHAPFPNPGPLPNARALHGLTPGYDWPRPYAMRTRHARRQYAPYARHMPHLY
ncbi:PC-esterase domain-containing protein 1A isoform X1 [Phyllopteryx taeniolatus]|uniref:PC-esterase domain-containing protein 1A isoform X1 n=1 Tax=Phyllopteryx taeniolatus TaxID=161469 RepID=UPI002AD1E93F|nr:PC-esterase domain-containing protein 1A isoform X1 [Phyllopteryx taeniolatus]XP_061620263.1 PC-esterase domain-containing protein 1A isoform X1 [Phyllopteryx taeniolatus]